MTAVLLGAAMTLAVRGYRFGESNHAVYLLDALRRVDPTLLTNDWWTTTTLQYHVVFTWLSAGLMKLGLLSQGYLAGYLTLILLLHLAWRRLTILLGGGDAVYLASVVVYYLLAGGLGLGVYEFLQDSSFLPSNISNVAMLWGIVELIRGRPLAAGAWLGVAGMFHLNYALVAPVIYGLMGVWETLRRRSSPTLMFSGRWWIGAAFIGVGSAIALAPALGSVFAHRPKLPLAEFVDLYVRLRHPHHYDPASWGWGLWLSFSAPLPVALIACLVTQRASIHPPVHRGRGGWGFAPSLPPPPQPSPGMPAEGVAGEDTVRRCAVVAALFTLLLVVALLGAGVWYASETLVQMSLYRFSIYLKLLSCIATAGLIVRRIGHWRPAAVCIIGVMLIGLTPIPFQLASLQKLPIFFLINAKPMWCFLLFAFVAALGVWRRPPFRVASVIATALIFCTGWPPTGLVLPHQRADDADYLALAVWAKDHTPRDAVFLVPPDEESFRLHARRAIVVNYKNVPQLSFELPQWRDRLAAVLGWPDLKPLKPPFFETLAQIRRRYDELPAVHLEAVAETYGARYIVATRPLAKPIAALVHSDANNRYFLYDRGERPRAVSP